MVIRGDGRADEKSRSRALVRERIARRCGCRRFGRRARLWQGGNRDGVARDGGKLSSASARRPALPVAHLRVYAGGGGVCYRSRAPGGRRTSRRSSLTIAILRRAAPRANDLGRSSSRHAVAVGTVLPYLYTVRAGGLHYGARSHALNVDEARTRGSTGTGSHAVQYNNSTVGSRT